MAGRLNKIEGSQHGIDIKVLLALKDTAQCLKN